MRKFQVAIWVAFVLFLTTFIFADEEEPWEFAAEANFYKLPERTYLNPVFFADKKYLHLEARYNYEDLDTGSIFAGYNFSTGETLEFSITPMIGGVFGNSDGIAPGFLLQLTYQRLSLSSEGEYFFSTDDQEFNFFYNWSEVLYSPVDWMWFGIAGQRTRAYQTDLEIQRGIALGFGKENFAITGYVMNIGWGDVFGVLSMEYSF